MNPAILAETEQYFVINKPAGMATEPSADGPTLRDWLIDQDYIKVGEWGEDERYGVVHRLDTNTSGVVLWAKNAKAQMMLRALWQGRQVKKTYLALVAGITEPTGTIELSIERDNQNDRQRVALLPSPKSRPSITHYETLATAKVGEWNVSFVKAQPVTGRTHQLRVHFKAIGHPIIGDKRYGEKASDELGKNLKLDRQFLHAFELCLPDKKCYRAPLPPELDQALRTVGIADTILDT